MSTFVRIKLLSTSPMLLLVAAASAQTPPLTPVQPDAIPLYPQMKAPIVPIERSIRLGPDVAVRNVTVPTLTPILPDPGKATGAAVIVAPGGAFMLLAMDQEGWNVARWLADHGIAAFVLKYRLDHTPADDAEAFAYMGERMKKARRDPDGVFEFSEKRATEDALAALKIVRADAAKWDVDPARVGMIGFSAGAMTTMNATLEGKTNERPAFIGYIYGPMLARDIPLDVPPMFAAIAIDDAEFGHQPYTIIDAWRRFGRPVEFHAYEQGGHGFGVGKAGTTTMGMMPQFREWMAMHGLLLDKATK